MKAVYAIVALWMGRGWVAIFVIFHYWGSFVTSSNDPIERSLPTVILPWGVRDARPDHLRILGIHLWNSMRCVPFNVSHNLRCECIKRAHFGKYISSNLDIGHGPFWQLGYRQFSVFVFRNVDLNYWLRSIIQYLCMSPNSVLATAFYLLSLDEDL